MTEPDWQALGHLIRQMQAEMRTIRSEHALLQNLIANAFSLLNDRIAQFESAVEAHFTAIDERLTRIEQLLKDKP
jgi:hypothetical protein